MILKSAAHSLLTIVGTLAVLSKSTGWLVVGLAAATYAVRQRSQWREAVKAALLVVALPIAIGGPFYGRLVFAERGSPLGLVTAAVIPSTRATGMSTDDGLKPSAAAKAGRISPSLDS